MIIKALKENYNNADYSSARMTTQNKGDWKYGRIEVRAKLPTGLGTWPAIWMMPTNSVYGVWPNSGEIDIMEHWGANQNYVQSALHTPSSYGGTINHGGQYISNATTQFNIFTLEWTPEQMIFSVNGYVHYTYNPESVLGFEQHSKLILHQYYHENDAGSHCDEHLS
mgnify:CR=1 FL=1